MTAPRRTFPQDVFGSAKERAHDVAPKAEIPPLDHNEKWLGWTALIALGVVILFVLAWTLPGCSASKPFSLGALNPLRSAQPSAPPPNSNPLAGIAWFCAIPGIALLVASVWFPLVRNMGAMLFGLGIGTALISAFYADYSGWIILTAGALAIGYAVPWLYHQWSERKFDADLRRKINEKHHLAANGGCDEEKAKAQGAADALEGLLT